VIVTSQATAPSRPSRILVYGVTGSGKSTLAARISAVTRLPWHSDDDPTWEPGWVAVPPDWAGQDGGSYQRWTSSMCAGTHCPTTTRSRPGLPIVVHL